MQRKEFKVPKLRELLEWEPVSLVAKNGRLRWSGYVEYLQ